MEVEVHVTGGIHQVLQHTGGYQPFSARETDDGVALLIEGAVVDDLDELLWRAVSMASTRAAMETAKELRIAFASPEAQNPV